MKTLTQQVGGGAYKPISIGSQGMLLSEEPPAGEWGYKPLQIGHSSTFPWTHPYIHWPSSHTKLTTLTIPAPQCTQAVSWVSCSSPPLPSPHPRGPGLERGFCKFHQDSTHQPQTLFSLILMYLHLLATVFLYSLLFKSLLSNCRDIFQR